jgi:ribose transport system substrate-binding protein
MACGIERACRRADRRRERSWDAEARHVEDSMNLVCGFSPAGRGKTMRVAWCLAVLAAFCGVGCGERPGGAAARRFVFITNGDDPFWDACNAGLQEGARRSGLADHGLRVVMEKNNGTAQGQIEKLRQFGSQTDVAGVAISVIQADNAAIVEEMRSLAAKGVQVITVDGDVNRDAFRDARPWYIGTDNVVGGRVLGAAARAILTARGHAEGGYVQFAGFTDNDNARARMNGFREAIGPAFTEIDRMPDEMNLAKARDNVRTALVNHPGLVALVGIWAYNAPAIAEVMQERGVRSGNGGMTAVTFDAQAAAIERMAAGEIDAMVVQNPFEMGIQAVRLLLAMHLDDQDTIQQMFPSAGGPEGDLYTTGLRLVVPDDAALVRPEDPGVGDVEYLPLSTFREWLARYGLSSS